MQQLKQQQKDVNNLYNYIYFGVYSALMVILTIFFKVLMLKAYANIVNTKEITILSYILISVIIIYAFIYRKEIFKSKNTALIAILTFALAGMVQKIMSGVPSLSFWMIFTVFLSYALNHYLGLLYTYFFLAQAVFYLNLPMNATIVLAVLGTVLNIGAAFAGKYFPLSILFIEEENAKENNNKKTASESLDMENGVAYLHSFAESLTYDSEEETVKEVVPDKEITSDSGSESLVERIENTDEEILYPDENNELVQTLKNIKKNAYIRSLRTAVFAEEAAEHAGADKKLTRAIAIFREIGRINGNEDYFRDTIEIAKSNDFPEKLIVGLEQVNQPKGSPICNAEAAIVAITGDIIKTYYFLKTNGSPYNTDKIVDTTVTKYVVSGMIDNSGLSVKNISELRVYFVDKLKELEEK